MGCYLLAAVLASIVPDERQLAVCLSFRHGAGVTTLEPVPGFAGVEGDSYPVTAMQGSSASSSGVADDTATPGGAQPTVFVHDVGSVSVSDVASKLGVPLQAVVCIDADGWSNNVNDAFQHLGREFGMDTASIAAGLALASNGAGDDAQATAGTSPWKRGHALTKPVHIQQHGFWGALRTYIATAYATGDVALLITHAEAVRPGHAVSLVRSAPCHVLWLCCVSLCVAVSKCVWLCPMTHSVLRALRGMRPASDDVFLARQRAVGVDCRAIGRVHVVPAFMCPTTAAATHHSNRRHHQRFAHRVSGTVHGLGSCSCRVSQSQGYACSTWVGAAGVRSCSGYRACAGCSGGR